MNIQQQTYDQAIAGLVVSDYESELDNLFPSSDYRYWLTRLLPRHFRDLDVERQFATHHSDFWDWAWQPKPDPPACMLLWNRGAAKSTSVEGYAVASGAQGWRKYALVVSRTQEQADAHVWSINSMLLNSRVSEYYPSMAEPSVKKVGARTQVGAWTRQKLTTASDWTVQGYGLLSSLRGIRVEEYRPDLIIVTDIDKLNDSLGMVDTMLGALAADVLATMASDCLVVFDQNLIHRGSVANAVYTRKSDMLSQRKVFGPVPALYDNPTYERRDNAWFITSGRPSWPGGMPLEECQAKLNLWGKDTWDREAQHDINKAYPDAIYPQWDEVFHCITWSEFARYFARFGVDSFDLDGKPKLPSRGKIVFAQDWGNNPLHPCANRWCWRPGEGMPLRRDVFFYREMCWPRFPLVEDDDRTGPSAMFVGRAIQDTEKAWQEESRIQWRIASHERPEIQKGYLQDLPLTGRPAMLFGHVDTSKAREGILHMQNFLTVERDQPHPFRVYPEGHPEAGRPLLGKPRVYFIVADGQGELYWDGVERKLKARPALDEAGQARTRFEYPNYRKPDTAEGAERKDAPKRDDDMVDCDRAIAGELFPGIQGLSQEEKLVQAMPAKFRQPKPEHVSEEAWSIVTQTARAAAKKEIEDSVPLDWRRRLKRKYRA